MALQMSEKKKNIRRNNIIQLVLSLAIIAVLNVIGSYVYTRIDLTSEKRYTLSDATRRMLRELDDIVFFRIYLDGDFPAGFKRLRNSTNLSIHWPSASRWNAMPFTTNLPAKG